MHKIAAMQDRSFIDCNVRQEVDLKEFDSKMFHIIFTMLLFSIFVPSISTDSSIIASLLWSCSEHQFWFVLSSWSIYIYIYIYVHTYNWVLYMLFCMDMNLCFI